MKLNGKVAIVTGGNSGIGRAASIRLAQEGASVVIAARNIEAAETVAVGIRQRGGRVQVVPTDVSRAEDVARLVDETIREFGQVDILVNNAGVTARVPLADVEEATWDRILDTNLKGTFLCTRAVMPHMIARKSGHVVNVGSAQCFRPVAGRAVYAASKGGIVAFSKSAALELAPYGVNVNVVTPGFTDTPAARAMHPTEEAFREAATKPPLAPPLGRVIQPEEIAEAIVFLCTDASRNITGQNLHVNGGSVMW